MYRYIPHESCSQFDSLPLTSLTDRILPVARCEGEREGVAVATVHLDHVRTLRRRMPLAAHAQPDVYASEVRVVVSAGEHATDATTRTAVARAPLEAQ